MMKGESGLRRTFWFLALAALFLPACRKSPREVAKGPLRLGFFPNITHAQALVGNVEGTFVRAMGDAKLEVKQFNAGPATMEALSSSSIEVSYVGSGPAINTFIKADRQLRVIAGAVNGGAVLVARTAKSPQDLKGATVASPELGNSQDVALRHWLKTQGLKVAENSKGDVTVLPLANPDILSLFMNKKLEGGWVPEPWGARLIAEGGGHILVDERELWPNHSFPTTLLVTTKEVMDARPSDIRAILRAHVELTKQWRQNRPAFETKVNDAFAKLTGKKLTEPVLKDAFSRIEPTVTPLADALAEAARHAKELGFVASSDLTGMVDTSLLEEVQRER
jgi:NitT/TauT family transport system substrate-binding protein